MDIMGFQVNMIWIKMSCHHVTFFNLVFLVRNCKFSWRVVTKIHAMIFNYYYYLYLVWIFLTKYWPSSYMFWYTIFIHDNINVYTHYIHICVNLSKFEPKISWRSTKAFNTKPLQNFDEIKRKFNFIIFNMKSSK
jgi:hypothetical protein